MKGALLYGPRDVRFEERDSPTIIQVTDAIIRISATCVCGSDLWPYRGIGIGPDVEPTPMGHEYCGIVEEIGSAVTSIKPGQFVIGSFFARTTPAPSARPVTRRQLFPGAAELPCGPRCLKLRCVIVSNGQVRGALKYQRDFTDLSVAQYVDAVVTSFDGRLLQARPEILRGSAHSGRLRANRVCLARQL